MTNGFRQMLSFGTVTPALGQKDRFHPVNGTATAAGGL
jgi:hypothetical protein